MDGIKVADHLIDLGPRAVMEAGNIIRGNTSKNAGRQEKFYSEVPERRVER
jgi:excinuclease UvrABC ATPase subunit